MTEPTQLEALFPEPRQVVLTSSRAVEILPLPIAKVPAFSKAITAATAVLMAGQIQLAIEEHYPGMRSAVSIATGLAEAEIDALLPDDFVALLAAVMEVNLDFFTRRVAPKLRQLAAVIAPGPVPPSPPPPSQPTDGSASPPSSPGGDTDPPNSVA